ncbi:hypothetical protein GCM10023189_31780 [Nibrella saemangeumensis]|uniref:Gfo/Idh/MocA-like oxidoreductase N-terminal domain-containing protein n=1 Tax=Nibrella saemangeumensis TaxID=1084526 RepID=A0ABP8N423_9BACT
MSSRKEKVLKLLRFAGIYGWQRAVNKAVGRTRPRWLRSRLSLSGKPEVSVIGCGQFAFSCVCFYLQKARGNVFLSAYDTDPQQAESLGRYYAFRQMVPSAEEVFTHPSLKLLYVISNHASHTSYAIEALRRGIDVYVEKPIAVSVEQLVQLTATRRATTARIFAGYNRPYARAVRLLADRVRQQPSNGGFSISYVINGHVIPPEHWYRQPAEGTRICGNLGHWLDLTLHIWRWRGNWPAWIDIQVSYANPDEPDDNLAITLTTDCNDIVTILLTSRTEPFEGISESINFQYSDVIARIDDFRTMTLWVKARKQTWRFFPKDVGHQRAVLQPYQDTNRDWHEVELSTLLMLHLKDMVLARRRTSRFIINHEWTRFETAVDQAMAIRPVPYL